MRCQCVLGRYKENNRLTKSVCGISGTVEMFNFFIDNLKHHVLEATGIIDLAFQSQVLQGAVNFMSSTYSQLFKGTRLSNSSIYERGDLGAKY